MIHKIQKLFSKAKTVQTRADESTPDVDELSSLENKIKAIMANVFKIDIENINQETSSDSIHQWSSLEHVDFIINLQKEFDIEFSDSQIVEMLSYPTAVQNVAAAIKSKEN